MGIVLIDRVVGVYDGRAQPAGQRVGHPEGAELALGVDHVRPPGHQLVEEAPAAVDLQPRAGIDLVGADGAHVVDVPVLVSMQAVGEGHHPDLVAQLFQLPLQKKHGGHHAVDDRRVPIRCDQNFHISPFRRNGAPRRPSDRNRDRSLIISNPFSLGKRVNGILKNEIFPERPGSGKKRPPRPEGQDGRFGPLCQAAGVPLTLPVRT